MKESTLFEDDERNWGDPPKRKRRKAEPKIGAWKARERGAQLRDEGIERVTENSGETFQAKAYAALLAAARELPELTSCDVWERLNGVEAHDNRALAGTMRAGVRAGIIENTGRTRPSRRAKQHVRPVTLWRSKLGGGE